MLIQNENGTLFLTDGLLQVTLGDNGEGSANEKLGAASHHSIYPQLD